MGIKKILFALLLVAAIGISGIWWLQRPTFPPRLGMTMDVAELLSEGQEGFARADAPWPFSFPRDYGSHPAYRMESWYFLGTLTTKQGREFVFQLTFFRFSLAPEPPQRASAWATNQVYRAHLALTDVAQNRFLAFERFSRVALGLSGAQASPIRVWLENWVVEVLGDSHANAGFHLQAGEDNLQIDLSLRGAKPIVLPSGLSGLGGAFHAYLVPRLHAQGTLDIDGNTFEVEGLAWLDRAWGSLPLPRGQVALNRFVLQLDDGQEILAFQLQRRDGSAKPINRGLLVRRDGSVRRLDRQDIAIDVLDDWISPIDGTRYPARWRLRIPAEAIDLAIAPSVADQELNLSVRYWGGAVQLTGTARGRPVGGNGYVELPGYTRTAIRS